jgi:hypothetical protein
LKRGVGVGTKDAAVYGIEQQHRAWMPWTGARGGHRGPARLQTHGLLTLHVLAHGLLEQLSLDQALNHEDRVAVPRGELPFSDAASFLAKIVEFEHGSPNGTFDYDRTNCTTGAWTMPR